VASAAASAGVPFTGVWLDAPPERMAERLRHRTRDASDATVAVLERQISREVGSIGWMRMDATAPAPQLATSVLASMRASR